MGRPRNSRPQLRRDSLGSGWTHPRFPPTSMRLCSFNSRPRFQDMRGASHRWRIPTTPCGIGPARRARLAAERRGFLAARWRD
jgi:hypothetical protein